MNIGLDIGTYAIKVATVKKAGNTWQIEQLLEVPNPIGGVLVNDLQQRQQLITFLSQAWKEARLPGRGIRVGLSEAAVVTKIITMPLLSDAELASAIQWQVEQHIPIPLDDMQYEYTVLRRAQRQDPQQDMDVFVVGVQKTVVQGMTDILLQAGIDAVDMETDTLALLRLYNGILSAQDNTALVHMGASSSTVVLLRQGVVRFVYTFPIGGLLLTRAIERGVGLDTQRAEEYKRTYGLLPDQIEGRVRQALLPVVQTLVAEIQKAFRFYSSQILNEKLEKMYVSGGTMYLPNLLPFLSETLSIEVVPAELQVVEHLHSKEAAKQDSRFSVAVGLAMKNG
jgi:type IV pilus assembly protein PilM